MSAAHEGPSLFLIEFGFITVCAGLSFCCPQSRSGFIASAKGAAARRQGRKELASPFGGAPGTATVLRVFLKRASYSITRLAARRALSVFVIGISAFLLRLLILPFSPIPQPFVEDDFSFLLAADTFAGGRLTSPTPALWTHFESFHITMTPTYMSMYFPAQGMALAAAKLLTGVAWFGVLATTALMCAALCWMLQAWLPPKWALLGGFLAILRLGLFSYWINTYTGGSIAALGGALVLGALPRIWRSFRARDFFWMALGMALLATSRPYEGLLISVPAVVILCWRLRGHPHPPVKSLVRRSAPALLLLVATLGFMAYYDHQVFGSSLTPPYKVNRETYAVAPHFQWQQPRPEPAYRHKIFRDLYIGWELDWFQKTRGLIGFLKTSALKLTWAGSFFLGFALLPPLLMLPRAIRDKRMRVLVIIGAVFVPGVAVETWMLPHYLAPFTPILYAVLLQCMRHMQAGRYLGRRPGVFFVRALPAVCMLLCVIRLHAQPLNLTLAPDTFCTRAWFGTAPLGLQRAKMLSDLENRPGKQLVLVRYSADHNAVIEWVYNQPDLPEAKVIWARDMGPDENDELLKCYSGRTVWLVEPDVEPPALHRYLASAGLHRRDLLASAVRSKTTKAGAP